MISPPRFHPEFTSPSIKRPHLIIILNGPPAQVFACTVGQKPSRAPFYVNDTMEVAALLSRLAGVEGPPEVSDDISMQL